eukprot:3070531-Heterocapsa_arctica.AAC.1
MLLTKYSPVATNDLAAKLRGAARAIADEEKFWASLPLDTFRCSQKLLVAGRAEFEDIEIQ